MHETVVAGACMPKVRMRLSSKHYNVVTAKWLYKDGMQVLDMRWCGKLCVQLECAEHVDVRACDHEDNQHRIDIQLR